MAWPTIPADMHIDNCMSMDFSPQRVYGRSYFAMPYVGFAACVFNVGSIAFDLGATENIARSYWSCQCYPCNKFEDARSNYSKYIRNVAGATGASEVHLRRVYPYITAQDLLTLKCLIIEAAENWRLDKCSTTNPQH